MITKEMSTSLKILIEEANETNALYKLLENPIENYNGDFLSFSKLINDVLSGKNLKEPNHIFYILSDILERWKINDLEAKRKILENKEKNEAYLKGLKNDMHIIKKGDRVNVLGSQGRSDGTFVELIDYPINRYRVAVIDMGGCHHHYHESRIEKAH